MGFLFHPKEKTMRLPAMLLAFALVPAVGALAQEPQPTPAPEQPAAQEPSAEPVAQAASAAPTGDAQTHIDAGLAAFRKRHFAAARQHFEQAVAADPNSAAANFYLGYTIYKIAEPKRPFHPDKQTAAELFAKAYQLDPTFKPAWSRRG
jgi:tetratricopeptide (TPR) repeat protein